MTPGIDHLVVGAADLDQGRRYVEDLLEVPMTPGGKHPQMGTHNCLLSLGPSSYLEVIAIDPEAPPPSRPRWFGLDHPGTAARLAEAPSLLTWVVHGVNKAELEASLRDRLGPIETMRRGDLEWQITIPDSGRPPAEGALPALIAWATGEAGTEVDHPAQRLPYRGCLLERLYIQHPEADGIVRPFTALGVTGLSAGTPTEAKVCQKLGEHGGEAPVLVAEIRTPRGLCVLSGMAADDAPASPPLSSPGLTDI